MGLLPYKYKDTDKLKCAILEKQFSKCKDAVKNSKDTVARLFCKYKHKDTQGLEQWAKGPISLRKKLKF